MDPFQLLLFMLWSMSVLRYELYTLAMNHPWIISNDSMNTIKYRAWSGAIGHMLFDFGIANLSLVGWFFKKWQNMSLMISILPFSQRSELIFVRMLTNANIWNRSSTSVTVSVSPMSLMSPMSPDNMIRRGNIAMKAYLYFASFYQNRFNFFILEKNTMKVDFILSQGINLSHFRLWCNFRSNFRFNKIDSF